MGRADDEAPDPNRELQDQLQGMARDLLRTADLPPKLGWSDFDFGVDPYDPTLDDLEGVLASGRAAPEQISTLLAPALDRHVTLPVRLGLLRELERRAAGEVRLDVRTEVSTVVKALHHLPLRASALGLLWKLYPPYMLQRLRDRREALAREESERPADRIALEEALAAGRGDAAAARALDLPALERLLFGWESAPPPDPALAKELIAAIAGYPGRRAARALGIVLWVSEDPGILEATRAALASMPEPAREIVRHHLVFHDPPPQGRRALHATAVNLGDSALLPMAVEDALGGGPWSQPGEGAEHASALLGTILKHGQAGAVPIALHLLSRRPPKADVREAVMAAFGASPYAAEFEIGLRMMEEGKPVVVPADLSQEEFLQKYGTFAEKMAPPAFQAEVRRMSALWEQCWHESLGWRRPAEVAAEVGPKEREFLTRLERECRTALGRLAGRHQVAELEQEFKVKWMTTPQNDVSGRSPLAIIFDERAARRHDPESDLQDRETEAAELYGRALRAVEAKLEDDARLFARAILQLLPDHAFAKDLLDRLDRGGPAGVEAGPEAASAPRIIIPG
jgi:hypothetical protein